MIAGILLKRFTVIRDKSCIWWSHKLNGSLYTTVSNMTKPVSRQNDQGSPEDEGSKKAKSGCISSGKVRKVGGKRGRKPSKIDQKAKLERSRQSARDCRARKKQKYQLLEEMVASKERAIGALREELDMYKQWCKKIDQGTIPPEIYETLQTDETTGNGQFNEETS